MEYHLAVKTAEEAVSSMKDAKLREIAFAQILAKLLTGEKQGSPGSADVQGDKPTAKRCGSSHKTLMTLPSAVVPLQR